MAATVLRSAVGALRVSTAIEGGQSVLSLMSRCRRDDDDLLIAPFVMLAGGVACGIGTLLLVREHPGGSLAGWSPLGAVALLSAGWLAIGVGMASRWLRSTHRFGLLLIGSGFAWFVTEWNNPAAGSSLVFTTGLLLSATCPPLVAHAALAFPSGRLRSPLDTAALASAYVGSLVLLGLGPALVFEPAEQGCAQCAANLVAVTNDPGLMSTFERAGVRIGVVWTVVVAMLAAWRVARATTATRRVIAPVLVPAIAYLAFVCGSYVHSLDRGFLSNDRIDRRWWLLQAAALVLVALGPVVEWMRVRRARTAIADMVVRLGEAPPPGGLRGALAATLGDPDLQIAFSVIDGRLVDDRGFPVEVVARRGRATTALTHDGETIAVLVHRADLLDDPRLVEHAAAAAQLALQHERLRAESLAHSVELHASRARLVAAADAERRRLERDLHDGAQQHLVGLALAARLLRTRLDGVAATGVLDNVVAAEAELERAIDGLRRVASGIHPAVLTDYGLAAAIQALAETAAQSVRLEAPTEERFTPSVELAAYLVVVEASKAGPVHVSIAHDDGHLVVDVDTAGEPSLRNLADRLAALDAMLDTTSSTDGTHIKAMIPCE